MTKCERVLDLLRLKPGQTSEELRQRLRNPHGAMARNRPDALLAQLRKQGLITGNGDYPHRHYPIAVVQGNDGVPQRIAVWKWPNAPGSLVKGDVQ